jgi:hypothetical protein
MSTQLKKRHHAEPEDPPVDDNIIPVHLLKTKYRSKTGQTLPDAFWQFWEKLSVAWNTKDTKTMQQLNRDPNATQYYAWIDQIRSLAIKNV